MSHRFQRADLLAALAAAVLIASLTRTWYGLSGADLLQGLRIPGLRADADLVARTGWQSSTVVGAILVLCAVAALGTVAARVLGLGVPTRPGHVVRAAGAVAIVLTAVRAVVRPSLIPGTLPPAISSTPSPHLEWGIALALGAAAALLVAGFLIDLDGRPAAARGAAAPRTGAPGSSTDAATELLASPPDWVRRPPEPGAPPPS